MPTRTDEQLPWDEGAALEELERLQRGIHEWRRRRKDVQTEFDKFVRGFRTPAQAEPVRAPVGPVAPVERPAGPAESLRLAEFPSEQVSPVIAPAATIVVAPETPAVAGAVPQVLGQLPSKELKTPGGSRRTAAIWITGAVAIVVGGFALKQSLSGTPDQPSATRATSAATSATATATSVPASRSANPQPAPAPSVPPTASEIVALQGVWVRVVVDGVKEVERELRAGERVPLPAGRTSVIRAGNAGSVRLTLDGQNRGTLGPEGEVITRTIRTAAAPTPGR
jgi:hypothetical protein